MNMLIKSETKSDIKKDTQKDLNTHPYKHGTLDMDGLHVMKDIGNLLEFQEKKSETWMDEATV